MGGRWINWFWLIVIKYENKLKGVKGMYATEKKELFLNIYRLF